MTWRNALPKYRFPAHENRPEDIFQVVSDELYLDGNARQNLATFGYHRIQQACFDTTQWLARQIGELGPFEFINDGNPQTGIPAVCFRVKPGHKLSYTLFDLSDWPLQRGWQVPAFALTVEAKDISVMRVMIRQGVSRDMAAPSGGGHQPRDRPFREASDHRADDPAGSAGAQPRLICHCSRRVRLRASGILEPRILTRTFANSEPRCTYSP